MNNKDLGQLGENLAEKYLEEKGYRTLARNFRTRFGEIDLVMQDGEYLVFVEVKTRRSLACGEPHEAIDARKQAQLLKMAEKYLAKNPVETDLRFDGVSVYMRESKEEAEEILHWENIIQG